MCGFLIEYSPENKKGIPKSDFINLLNDSKTRGPDFQGYFSNDLNLQMGFNRLAILELSEAGEQPMKSHNGRYVAGIPWVFTKKNMNWGGSSKNAWNLRSFLARKIAVQNTDMIKQFYPKSKKTVLIPRGVNVSSFKNTKNQEVPMQILDFPDDKRYLICVANLVPVKGVEILIHAFHKILAKHPKWHLLVVGDDTNDYGDELKQLVSELTMDDKITFTGKQLDILPFLDKAEVFILPTKDEGRREGSPVSLLEAMANGKVVIGSDIPGIRDQLAKFPDSLFKASNIDDLSQKLEHYMSQSPEELKRIGTVFYNHVHLEYPLKKEIKRHEDLYRMIIK